MEFTVIFTKSYFYILSLAWPLLVSLMLSIVLLGQLVGRLEKWTPFNSLYWAFITATTVGYGDIRPSRPISRVLSIFIALVGLVFTGIMVAVAVETTSFVYAEVADVDKIRMDLKRLVEE